MPSGTQGGASPSRLAQIRRKVCGRSQRRWTRYSPVDVNRKVAIVTGGGGAGCGRSIARCFAREGADVLVSDIDDTGGAETVRVIEADGGVAAFGRCDVRNEEQVRQLISFAEDRFGGLDYLINNASAPVHFEAPLDYWKDTIETDLLGAMYAMRAAIDAFRRRGGGSIV